MQVVFYYNRSDDRVINKDLVEGATFTGQARDEVNIMAPIVRFDTPNVIRYNYAYIPELQRYYTISDINVFREGLYDVTFAVDVLMSFRGHILQLPVIVDKQTMDSNGDEYIDDGSLVMDNVMFTRCYNFPSGFNSTPEYVLITAG